MIFHSIQHQPVTASQVVATRLFGTVTKAFVFGLRAIWAFVVLVAVCLLWLLLFFLFAPFLLIAALFSRKESTAESPAVPASPAVAGHDKPRCEFIFDRRRDISKLFGCNTRNVQYRWNVFSTRIDQIKRTHQAPLALDFGAGSLRDSFELARLGFKVTSVDLDPTLLEEYARSYDWSTVASRPSLFTRSLKELPDQKLSPFQLAIAFDVIEHLETPEDYCKTICSLLDNDGLFFTIVPNKRSIFERHFKRTLKDQRARGVALTPGVPHLQFKSPEEWNSFFQQCGFKILQHEMAIGFFVNDCWNGLLGLPLRVYVAPVLTRLSLAIGVKFNAAAFEEAFSPKWLMKHVNSLDELLRNRFASHFGWNLIVAQKNST